MPKIGTIKFKIDGVLVECQMHYSTKDKFHVKGFPKHVEEVTRMRFSTMKFNTEYELKSTAIDLIAKYHEIATVTEKVIHIQLSIPKEMYQQPEFPDVVNSRYENKEWAKNIPSGYYHDKDSFCITHSTGIIGFIIDYDILFKNSGNGIKYYTVKKNPDSTESVHSETSRAKNSLEIPWTIEREQFLKSLEANAESMVRKIVEFFFQDKDLLIEAIDHNQRLLPGKDNC